MELSDFRQSKRAAFWGKTFLNYSNFRRTWDSDVLSDGSYERQVWSILWQTIRNLSAWKTKLTKYLRLRLALFSCFANCKTPGEKLRSSCNNLEIISTFFIFLIKSSWSGDKIIMLVMACAKQLKVQNLICLESSLDSIVFSISVLNSSQIQTWITSLTPNSNFSTSKSDCKNKLSDESVINDSI